MINEAELEQLAIQCFQASQGSVNISQFYQSPVRSSALQARGRETDACNENSNLTTQQGLFDDSTGLTREASTKQQGLLGDRTLLVREKYGESAQIARLANFDTQMNRIFCPIPEHFVDP